MSTLDLILSDFVINSDLALYDVVVNSDPVIEKKQIYKNTKRYDYNDLKQFAFLKHPNTNIDKYAYIDASGLSDGKNISTAIRDYWAILTAKIPVIPDTFIEYKVFKTKENWGNVFLDSDMTIIKSLSNDKLNSGTSVTLKVPENAAFFVFCESTSLHEALDVSSARVTIWEI